MDEKFSFDSLQDGKSIATFLDGLAWGFASGTLLFKNDGQAYTLNTHGEEELLEVSIKAKKKGGRSKVSLTVSWRERPFEEDAP